MRQLLLLAVPTAAEPRTHDELRKARRTGRQGDALAKARAQIFATLDDAGRAAHARCAEVPGWFKGQHVYEAAARRFGGHSLLLEIGAYLGQSSCFMASLLLGGSGPQRRAPARFHVIDIWGPIEMYAWAFAEDLERMRRYGGAQQAWTRHMLDAGALPAVETITHASSIDPRVAARYAERSVHFVYLDTSHREESTTAELTLWWPKIAPGGWLCGDDFCSMHGAAREGHTARAVDSFFSAGGAWRNSSAGGSDAQPTRRLWAFSQYCVGKGVDPVPPSRVRETLGAGAFACA